MGKLGKLLELVRTLKKEGFTVKKLSSKKNRRRIAAAKEGVKRLDHSPPYGYNEQEYEANRSAYRTNHDQIKRLIRGRVPRETKVDPGFRHSVFVQNNEDAGREEFMEAVLRQLQEHADGFEDVPF